MKRRWMQQHCSTMRRLVHISLLAAALCAVADATYVNYLPAQSVLQPVVAYPAQSYGYNLPPVQRYIYLHGQPYAVLGEQIQYLPAASAATYTASNQLGAGAVTVNAAQEAVPPVSPEAASIGQAAPDASTTAYAGAATSSAASAAEAAPVESSEPASRGQDPAVAAVAPEAASAPAAEPAPSAVPAAETSPVLPADSITPGRGLDSAVAADPALAAAAAAPAAAPPAVPAAETEPVLQPVAPAADGRGLDSVPAVVPEASPVPAAAAPAPAAAEPTATRGSFPEASPSADAPTTQTTSVYLSPSSGPSVPLAQRFLVLSVNNPKVTVRRQDTVYSWHHPEQAVNAPLKMVFYKDPLAPAPASDPLQIGSKTISIQSNGLTATINPQPNEILGNSVDPAKVSVYSQPQPSAFQPSTTPVFSAPQPAAPQTSPITLYSSPQTTTTTVYSAAQPSPSSQPSASVYSATQPSPSQPSPPQPSVTVYSAPQPSASVYSASQPSVTVYSAPQPSASVYSASQPSVSVYSAPQPSASVYSASQPSASVYSASQPSASVYSASQPSASVYSAPKPSAPLTASAEDLIRYTLSQSPLLRVHVDPVTHTSYFLDSQGRRIDLTASAPAAPPAPVYQTTTDYAHTGPYTAAPSSAAPASSDYAQTSPQYYGSAKGLPAPSPSGASENYKAYDMAGLAPLERMYAPSTYKGPVPQSPTYDKPLTLSISTGKEAESSVAGPASPLSPGDFGPSRGDSVDNPSRPKPLWSDARAR